MTDEKKDEKKSQERPGILEDGRAHFHAVKHPTQGWMLSGPDLVISGFTSSGGAFAWLRGFLDDVARRNHDVELQRQMNAERVAIEREEMLARLFEPRTKQ